MSNEPHSDESEEYMKFEAAMQQILSVRKIDIVDKLPKMFRERKPAKKKAARKKRTRKSV